MSVLSVLVLKGLKISAMPYIARNWVRGVKQTVPRRHTNATVCLGDICEKAVLPGP